MHAVHVSNAPASCPPWHHNTVTYRHCYVQHGQSPPGGSQWSVLCQYRRHGCSHVCGVHQLRLLECVCMCVQVARAHLLVHLHETLTSVSHVFNLHIIAHWFSYSIQHASFPTHAGQSPPGVVVANCAPPGVVVAFLLLVPDTAPVMCVCRGAGGYSYMQDSGMLQDFLLYEIIIM